MKKIFNALKRCFYIKNDTEQQEINKQLIVIVVSIFVTVVSVLGVTYSAFVWSDNSLKNQSLIVGNVELSINSSSESLGSSLNYPVAKEDESSLTPYTFTIKNNGTLSSLYKLKIVADDAYTNTMDTNYIYMSMSGGRTINRTPLSSYSEIPFDEGILASGASKTYDLRLWIVENAPNSVIGKAWHGKIVLESIQTDIIADVDVSDLTLVSDSNINTEAKKIEFSIKNNENTTKYLKLDLDEITISNELKSSYFKWKLLEGESIVNEGDFNSIRNSMLLQRGIEITPNQEKTYNLLIWYSNADASGIDLTDKTLSAKISAELSDSLSEIALSESPVLMNTVTNNQIKNFKIFGNSVQNGIPTLNNPVEIESVGDLTLPEEYQQVEYIESTGTQYIDMKYAYRVNDEINIEFSKTESTGAIQGIFGNGNLPSYTGISLYSLNNDTLSATIGGTLGTEFYNYSTAISYNTKYEVKFSENKMYLNNNPVLTVSNNLKDGTQEDFSLFRRWGTNTMHGRIYKFNVKRNGEFVFNMLPCYRKSDKEIGLYDLVNGTFYTNSGTGTFKRGEDTTTYRIPLKISGKNLVKYPYKDTTKTVNGITFTDNGDGTITINGTASANTNFNIETSVSSTWEGIKPNETYTVSTSIEGNYTGSINFTVNYYPKGSTNYSAWASVGMGKTVTKSFPKNIAGIRSYIHIPSGSTANNLIIKPQLELGTTNTKYEPYVAPIVTDIYLKEPLRKIGDYEDYIDFESGKVVRKIYNEFIDSVYEKSSLSGTYKIFLSEISKKPFMMSSNQKGFAISNKFQTHTDVYANLLKYPNSIQSYITSGGLNRVAFTFDDSSITTDTVANEKIGDGFDVCYVLHENIEESIQLSRPITMNGVTNITVDTKVKPLITGNY